MTKAERRNYYVDKWLRSGCSSVFGFYNNPSDNKVNVEMQIKRTMIDLNGKRYRVISGSCYAFQCAYAFPKNDKWFLRVETQGNSFEYELTEEEVRRACI